MIFRSSGEKKTRFTIPNNSLAFLLGNPLIATPFALGSSIFMTEISPKFGEKFYRPMVEIFAGIPSVVYGWVGLTVLIPFLFDLQVGHSILAASLVLSIMIFPSITSVASDAIRAVSKETRMAAYGLGSTRWQTIFLFPRKS